MAEKLSSSTNRRRGILVTAVVALVILTTLVTAMLTTTKSPDILRQQFTSSAAASTFATSGSGSWKVVHGTYVLKQPPTLASTANTNVSLSVSKKKITSGEWKLHVDAKALSTTNPHDFSVVFDYLDAYNYSYANLSDTDDRSSNGIFRVSNGRVASLATFTPNISANQTYSIEVRKKAGTVTVYRNKVYLAQAHTGVVSTDVQVGFGSRGGSAVFDNLVIAGKGSTSTTAPTPTPPPSAAPASMPTPTPSGGRTVKVVNGEQLEAALAAAQAGDVIDLADGTYTAKGSAVNIGAQVAHSKFRLSGKSGTTSKPIIIQGSRNAVIDGKGPGSDYGLHIAKSSYVSIRGIRVTNNKKGIVFDDSSHNVVDGVMVDSVGSDAIRFRTNSSDNVVKNSFIAKTGLAATGYGGISIGSDASEWSKLNGGKADQSDRNQVLSNAITEFTAAGVDIKEASDHNLVKGNYFDGSSLGGTSKTHSADSWVDVKGNNNLLTENSGVNVLIFNKNSSAAFQTHVHGPSGYNSASDNTFSKNTIRLNGPGYGFFIDSSSKNNVVTCDNVVANAGHGLANIACRH